VVSPWSVTTRPVTMDVGDEGFLTDTEGLAAITEKIELARDADPGKREARVAKGPPFPGLELAACIEPFSKTSSLLNLATEWGDEQCRRFVSLIRVSHISHSAHTVATGLKPF